MSVFLLRCVALYIVTFSFLYVHASEDECTLLVEEKSSRVNYANADYTPYLLEDHHPTRAVLDAIFSQYNPLKSSAAINRAGFFIVSERPSSMLVLAHPKLKGYLLKLYPSDQKDNTNRNMTWAVKRCIGAENIRSLIKEKKLKYFSVPKKWIYFVPDKDKLESQGIANYAVLVVEDMRLLTTSQSRAAWRNASHELVKELYTILSQGYSSCYLAHNIPLTKDGKFSCIDTESPQRRLPFAHVNKHLGPEMQRYWDKLVREGGNTPGFLVK